MAKRISPFGKKMAAAVGVSLLIGWGGMQFFNGEESRPITGYDETPNSVEKKKTGYRIKVSFEEAEKPKPKPKPKKQKTAAWRIDQNGRNYIISEGEVIEGFPVEGYGLSRYSSGDKNIYDFDLGVIYRVRRISDMASMVSNRFNELVVDGQLPRHIEDVKQIGCNLSRSYIKRAQTDEYGPAPSDVLYFHENHCKKPTIKAAPKAVSEKPKPPQIP